MLDQNSFVPVILVAVGLAISAIWLMRRFYANQLAQKEKNLTELKVQLAQTQQQSFHDKSELNAILSSMVEGVIVIDDAEQILYVSPNVSAMLEMRAKEVTSKPYWEVIRHQEINACFKEALQQAKAVKKEIVLIGPESIVFNMQISPVVQQGKLTSVVAVFHDITEFKKLIRMRSEFVANVSHELKTPLTSIKGFVETLSEKDGLEDADAVRRFLGIIHKQTQRLEMLVDDLLTLSAIESKEEKMDCAAEDVAHIVRTVLMMKKRAIDLGQLHVTTAIPVDLPNIYVDRDRIDQVLINLLDNAIKFTPSGGKIHIQAKAEPPYVRIDVEDSGTGIAPEHLSRIFERFYRADKSRTSEGTGLGLSIVKHIVYAHQGKIEVQSSPQGSTFSVFLPLIK